MPSDGKPTIQGILSGGLYQYSPQEIKTIREKLKLSHVKFARMFFATKSSCIKWESGERKPSGSTLRLLQFVESVADGKAPNINSKIRKSYRLKYGETVSLS